MVMKKKYVICLLLITISAHAMQQSPQKEYDKATGIAWSKDSYNNLCLNLENINSPSLAVLLKTFIMNHQADNVGNAFIIEHAHEPAYRSALINAGFSFYHATQDGTKWVIKNGSPMPAAVTTLAGACVIVHKDGKVLMVEEKHKPGRLFFPGGAADPEEFIINAAQRELQEEVGLIVKLEDLRLLAFTDRIKANAYGYADCYHYFFVEQEKVFGKIQLQSNEILQTKWVSLEALAALKDSETIGGFKMSSAARTIAKHILNPAGNTIHIVPDISQYITGNPDQNNTMYLYLFNID